MLINPLNNMNNIKGGLKNVGKKLSSAATSVASGTKELTTTTLRKAEAMRQEAIYKKYTPLAVEEYFSDTFKLPSLLIIESDSSSKREFVNSDSIGWIDNSSELVTLHLFEEFLPKSALHFVPEAACDTAYYVDPHDRKAYISVDYIMNFTNNARNAELSNIAYCLGAKSYRIETRQSESSTQQASTNLKVNVNGLLPSAARDTKQTTLTSTETLSQGTFREVHAPIRPDLVWFAKDPIINELVNSIVDRHALFESKDIQISGSSCSTMAVNVAAKIEGTLSKLGIRCSANIKKSAEKEHNYDLLFHLEF